jgi:hypothetical protein
LKGKELCKTTLTLEVLREKMFKNVLDSLCCVLPFLTIAAIAGIFWLWRSWSTRGFQAAIAMDGATCFKADNGDVVIKRHNLRNWLYLIVLTLALFGVVAMLFAIIIKALNGTSTLEDVVEGLGITIGVGSIIGIAMFSLVHSLQLSAASFNAGFEMLEIGIGYSSSLRQIPFSRISRVVVGFPERHSMGGEGKMGVFGIGVLLDDGEELLLGTVSGKIVKTEERAAAIAQLIADVTGASRG